MSPAAVTGGRGVQHVLLDADGLLQVLPPGWLDAARVDLGDLADQFPATSWHDDPAALRGRADFLADLAARLTADGTPTAVEDLRPAVPHSITPVAEVLAVVPRLRGAGYGVHLGSNQEQHRAAYMRTALGYDDLFDVSCYSCDLGVTKPSPQFFTEAARRIGAEPGAILFVDDLEANVEGARSAGLIAERWHVDLDARDRGVPGLLDLFARHGVTVAVGRTVPRADHRV